MGEIPSKANTRALPFKFYDKLCRFVTSCGTGTSKDLSGLNSIYPIGWLLLGEKGDEFRVKKRVLFHEEFNKKYRYRYL
jgi:hypothetical protein